jgi:hypothetical protein
MARGFEASNTFRLEGRSGTVVAGRLVGGAAVHIGDALVDGEVVMRIKQVALFKTGPRQAHAAVGVLVDIPEGYEVQTGQLFDVQPSAG